MPKKADVLKLLASVDWPKAMHMGGALMRELRGDDAIDGDAERARTAGRKTQSIFEQIGRAAAGCVAPNPCPCPWCKGEKDP